ncbi:MAG: valine--tRNA ligase [bacterium]|nr:valine--tRNA ligase [bacterium]
MEINEKLLKPYNAKDTEDRIYKLWEDSGFFNPDVCVEKGITNPNAETFSIVLPPPNATGVLHLGHALEDSMQDTMIRYNRMRGKKTLWVPGTDHAAIATDSKVTKILEKQGLKKKEIGREKFLEHVHEFVADSRKTIVGQLRKMGASLDWSREAFTLDDERNFAVKTAFKKMYEEGLIYRGYRIVNWDPKGQTVISDDEIVNEERKGKLYTFKYGKNFPISISTTRPETKVGDVAVAVHPEDERYKEFVGKEYDEVFCGVPIHIKVIADEHVEKDFGTGALGVTPAHSQIDWEMSQKNKLPVKPVINEYAKMTVGDERILDKKTTEARDVIVEWLKSEGLLEKEEDITQNLPTAERTGGTIEPLPKLQWFINVNKKIKDRGDKSLKELMLESVREGNINILPDHFEKVYFNWIENLRDWCISRQIWYGHRIPVWYRSEEIFCGIEAPEGDGWVQDEDTLDTWFSSGLWTFSTLGWPKDSPDFKNYHPTNVVNPGYEILFFWVARMILMSQYLLGDIPFKTVYLHGMLRDAKGQKFSKSLNNGIDPIEVINDHGADALRMSLIVGIGPGADSKFDIQKVKAYSKFVNKIWNATRFVLDNTKDLDFKNLPPLDEEDKKSEEELEDLIKEITKEMDEYKFYLVAEKLYHYFWHTFADVIIERSKKKILEGNNADSAKALLYTHLITLVKALHPFIPFVTEEIWSMLPMDKNLLLVESWPKTNS